MVSVSLNQNYKLSFLPSSICPLFSLIPFCYVLKMKPKLDWHTEALVLRKEPQWWVVVEMWLFLRWLLGRYSVRWCVTDGTRCSEPRT